MLSIDRYLGSICASSVINDAVSKQKGCIIFIRFYAELTFFSLGRLAHFVEKVIANATRPSSMKREPDYHLCGVAWTLQQHPTQGRKLDRFRHQLVFLGCELFCIARIQVFQRAFDDVVP